MGRVLFNRFGIVAFQHSDASLIIIGFWRLFAVAFNPRTRWIEVALCDGPTRRRLPGFKYHLEPKQ